MLSQKLEDAETDKIWRKRLEDADAKDEVVGKQDKEMREAHRRQLEWQIELNKVNREIKGDK